MEAPVRFAGETGISSLYHYQDFQPGAHADRLADILQNHRIYCSNPADFNDPWDGRPYFDPDLLDDPVNQAATAEYFIANRHGGPKGDAADQRLRSDLILLKQLVHVFSEDNPQFISEQWGLYCLTSDPCSTLMWSHYSRNHKGICLEFSVADTKFRIATKVRYQKEYPSFLLHDDSGKKMLEIKSDVWSYEEEFRLLCPRFTDELKGHPLVMNGNYLSIDAGHLKSIIIGCQAEPDTTKIIQELVREYAPHVAVRKAIRALNKYRLVIEG